MLEEIYKSRQEEIDKSIKKALKSVENELLDINKDEIEEKIEENYNIKIGAICKEVYLQGLKDGINIINEAKM